MESPSIIVLCLAIFFTIGLVRSLFTRPEPPHIIYVQQVEPEARGGASGGVLVLLGIVITLFVLSHMAV
jgi:hypothetical protein